MRDTLLQFLFWACAALVVYVYAGYPVLLYFLARWMPQRRRTEDIPLPCVTLIISAYNERAIIAEKLANALALDYPPERLEILVISDCSDDGTDDVVKSFRARGVRLVRQQERLGKTAGLNLGVPLAAGDILVFSDANALYQPDALRHLVRPFSDPAAGYVVGNARYAERVGLAPSAVSEGLYWKLETWLKRRESEFGSVVGGDGAIYAIRRGLYAPLQPADINDLLNPLQIIAKGYRGLFEPAAVCYEEAGGSFEKEFRRKVRIIGRSMNAVRRTSSVLLPWTQPRHWFALVSHKLLRWLAPIFLLAAFVSSLLLWRYPLYRMAAILEICFYTLAFVGWAVGRKRAVSKLFYLPHYFCLVNLASLLGLVNFLRGSLPPTWQTARHEIPAQQDSSRDLARRES